MSATTKFEDCSHAVWKGSITLEVEIAECDLSSSEIQDPIFVSVNRFSYLPVALHDIVEYFRQHTIEFASDSWFECNSHALLRYGPSCCVNIVVLTMLNAYLQ
jgi:hypothetical protein